MLGTVAVMMDSLIVDHLSWGRLCIGSRNRSSSSSTSAKLWCWKCVMGYHLRDSVTRDVHIHQILLLYKKPSSLPLIRRETETDKKRFQFRDLSTNYRSSRAVLDFLKTTSTEPG